MFFLLIDIKKAFRSRIGAYYCLDALLVKYKGDSNKLQIFRILLQPLAQTYYK